MVYFSGGSWVVFAFALLASACGGSSESPGPGAVLGQGGGTSGACPAVTPCGGDLVGEWSIKQMCLDELMTSIAGACPGTKITLSQVMGSGSISFKADKTMSSSAVITFNESVQLPTSCYSEAQCTNVAAVLAADASVMNSHCGYDAVNGCSCTLTARQTSMGDGTYEVQGTNVNLTNASTGKTEVDSFCVSGNTASLFQHNDDGSGTIILTR